MKYQSMDLSIEKVTPAIAKRWLEQNRNNRRIRRRVVDQYARDMVLGKWEPKPIAISFDETGWLGNGQHTLSAIIASDTTQELLIARNVSRSSIAAMDVGLRRSIADVSHFLEVDITRKGGTIARIIEFGVDDTRNRSFSEIFDAYTKHDNVIDFVLQHGKEKSCGFSGAVMAVCARAAYTRDKDKIARFLGIISKGVVAGDHELAALRFRDFVRSLRGATSIGLRKESYQKAECALDHFLRDRPITKLHGTEMEQFPIPDHT